VAQLRERGSKGNSTKTHGMNESPGKGRPPFIVLSSEANLISLQRELKSVVSDSSSGTLQLKPITKSMVDYNAIQKFLTKKNLHFFTFYTKVDKLVKAVIRHLPGNISAVDITVALQEIDYNIVSLKQMTAKRLIAE
jgi:hypothetical protein